MATSFTGTFSVNLSATLQDTSTDDLGTPTESVSVTDKKSVADGNGANQAEDQFSFAGTLSSGASKSVDVKGGSDANAFGTTLDWTKSRVIYLKNTSSDGGPTAVLSGDLIDEYTGQASSQILLKPGSRLYLDAMDTAGVAVQAGSRDTVTVTHNADGSGDLTFDLYLAGTTS